MILRRELFPAVVPVFRFSLSTPINPFELIHRMRSQLLFTFSAPGYSGVYPESMLLVDAFSQLFSPLALPHPLFGGFVRKVSFLLPFLEFLRNSLLGKGKPQFSTLPSPPEYSSLGNNPWFFF